MSCIRYLWNIVNCLSLERSTFIYFYIVSCSIPSCHLHPTGCFFSHQCPRFSLYQMWEHILNDILHIAHNYSLQPISNQMAQMPIFGRIDATLPYLSNPATILHVPQPTYPPHQQPHQPTVRVEVCMQTQFLIGFFHIKYLLSSYHLCIDDSVSFTPIKFGFKCPDSCMESSSTGVYVRDIL